MKTKESNTAAGVPILEYAARQQAAFSAHIESLNGYKTITTFWGDLTIAEAYGHKAVRDTFANVKKEWAGNYKFWTEFVLCLNHKIWYHYQKDKELARVYDELWREADAMAAEWEGDAAAYYYNVTD